MARETDREIRATALEQDLEGLEQIQPLVESFEAELKYVDGLYDFTVSKRIRIEQIQYLINWLNHADIRSAMNDVLANWADNEISLNEITEQGLGSKYVSQIYQNADNGEYSYD